MLLGRFRIQPEEKRRFTVDYTKRLNSVNLTLASVVEVRIEPITVPPLVIQSAIDADGLFVLLYTSGGVDGTEYKLELFVQTSDNGVLWEDEILFTVEDI